MRAAVVLACAAIAAAPLNAQTYQTENRVTVSLATGGFDVPGGGEHGARGIWCAAADFARQVRGAAGTDRLYIAQARQPGFGPRPPVRFTLDKSGLTPVPVTLVGLSLRTVGSVLSVDHAGAFCADAKGSDR